MSLSSMEATLGVSPAREALASMSTAKSAKRGRAVLVLHGLGVASLDPHLLVSRLRGLEFRVLTQRIDDFGARDPESHAPDAHTTFRDWISAGTTAVENLAATHAEINVCGISLGATLALAVVAELPGVLDSLTIISTPIFHDGWNVSSWRRLMPLLYHTPLWRLYRPRERNLLGIKNKQLRSLVAEQLQAERPPSWSGSTLSASLYREAHRLTRHVKNSLGQVLTPTLLIHARQDDVASLTNVRYVCAHLGTDQSSEAIVENSYHMITFDNDFNYAMTKIIRFIDVRSRPRAGAV